MPLGERGPYLTTAVLCERVLEEKDGVKSLIRIVDRITTSASGTEPAKDMPSFTVQLTAAINLKSGEAQGRFGVRLKPHDPSGQQMGTADFPIQLEQPPTKGVFLGIPLNLQVTMEGVYWIDVVFVDDKAEGSEESLLTRLSLQIVYQPQRIGPTGQ